MAAGRSIRSCWPVPPYEEVDLNQMNISEYLSDDGHVMLVLCSHFGLPETRPDNKLEPFRPSEWNQLANRIENSALKSPAGLNGLSASDLQRMLSIPLEDAERIGRLLDRSGKLAIEVEALFSHGMWVVTRCDALYPEKLRTTLKQQAPPVIFGAGLPQLFKRPGVAVIGSRNLDEAGAAFAREVGRKAVNSRMAVISGGARGTDRLAMDGAIEAGGVAIGALADSLEGTIRKSDVRELLLDERLVLFTPHAPSAGFSVGAAMGRNKYIYGLSQAAVVVSSDHQTGGTWAGAVEALKGGWCPVFVRESSSAPNGNRELEKMGAAPLPESDLDKIQDFSEWLQTNAKLKVVEQDLFDLGPR
jgi:predicted Rossmann fold nucleotide-binding protein DprA/Smf involved in DNA uptake